MGEGSGDGGESGGESLSLGDEVMCVSMWGGITLAQQVKGVFTLHAFPQGLRQRCQGEYQAHSRSPRNQAKEAVAVVTEWLMVDDIE